MAPLKQFVAAEHFHQQTAGEIKLFPDRVIVLAKRLSRVRFLQVVAL